MTLTVGGAPLAGRPAGQGNFTIEAPEHRLLLEDYPHRLRAVVAGRTVLDTLAARLLHETGHQVVPYAPLADFDEAALTRSETVTTCPFKGEASYWSVQAGGQRVEDAVWAYESPLDAAAWLAGLAALRWDAADAWYVEDEPVFGPHLRDPYHRVDVYESSRPATARVGDEVIAHTPRPKLLFETSLPVRVYFPAADVSPGVLAPSEKRTRCPYKGEASYWSVELGERRVEDAGWSYPTPLTEALKVTGHVSFLHDDVTVELAELPARDGR